MIIVTSNVVLWSHPCHHLYCFTRSVFQETPLFKQMESLSSQDTSDYHAEMKILLDNGYIQLVSCYNGGVCDRCIT